MASKLSLSPCHLGVVLGLAFTLGGCHAWLGDERSYALEKEWHQLRTWDWMTTGRQLTGLRTRGPQPIACTYLPTGRRTTNQDGVVDEVMMTECWNATRTLPAGPTAPGSRMGNRPETM